MDRVRFQRLFLILTIVVLAAGILVTVWFLFFRPFVRPPTNANVNINGQVGPLPNINVNRPAGANVNAPLATGTGVLPEPSEIANGDLTLTTTVGTSSTTAAALAPDGKNIMYYDSVDGRFVRLDPSTGSVSEVSKQRFPDIQNIAWAPDRTKAVLEFPDGRKIVYDFGTQKQSSLPNEAQDFSFSADSRKLAYEFIGPGPDEQFIVTASSDGSGAKAVAKVGDKADHVQVAWSPSDETVALFRKGTDADQQEIIFIGQNQENFKTLPTDGRGFVGEWTPDGTKLLYTVYSDATNWNPELHLVLARGDQIGQGDVNLGLSTFVEKCTFSSSGTHAFCAVPDILERGSGLYPEFADAVNDTIYSINLQNGLAQPLAQPVTSAFERFTIDSLFVSNDESTLFFTDRATRRVHKIRLK